MQWENDIFAKIYVNLFWKYENEYYFCSSLKGKTYVMTQMIYFNLYLLRILTPYSLLNCFPSMGKRWRGL